MQLDGPRAKLDRAIYHLKTLDSNCERFLKTQPFYVAAEFEPDVGCHVVRLRVREGIPLTFSVALGDVLHNLRSGLDQAAWLIACRSTPVRKLWKRDIAKLISFPIVLDCREFPSHSLMAFIADDAKTVLERLQPYHRTDSPRDHPLARLNRLWNIDKHRVVHGGYGALDMRPVSFIPKLIDVENLEGVDVEWFIEHGGSVEDGTKVAEVRFPGIPEPQFCQVEMKGQPSAQIAFGSGGEHFGMEPLVAMLGATVEALTEIEALPDTPANQGAPPS